MVELSADETALVDELLDCIAEAMEGLDEVDVTYANKTKLQKLLYLAIDEYELPVTYSWYLAGAVVPGDAATPAHLESAFDSLPGPDEPATPSSAVEPTSVDERADTTDESPGSAAEPIHPVDDFANEITESADEGTESSAPLSESTAQSAESDDESIDPVLFTAEADDGSEAGDPSGELGDRRAEIVDFYEVTIPDVWYQNTMRFLQNFYLDHAPAAYRDLYVQSTHFRTRLRELEEVVADHVAGDRPDQSIPDLVEAAELDISDMHCTIRASEALAATFDGFVEGTDRIEDGLMMLAQRSPESLERQHVAAVQSMQEFFYYYVWRYPCLVISQETVTGPSADALRSARQRRLADFDAELEREGRKFERELAAAGLRPDYTDYSRDDDELAATIDDLADQYLEQ